MEYWIDKRATGARTGAPDESPDADGIYQNAWRSFREYWDNKTSVTTNDRLNVAPNSGPYDDLFHVADDRHIYSDTGVSFDSATRQIRKTGIGAILTGVTAGNTLRVVGSDFNDRQFTVDSLSADAITVVASNNITNEAASASIDIVRVEYSDQCTALDLGKNGTSAVLPMKLNVNKNRIYGGIRVLPGNTKYLWNRSSLFPNLVYLTMLDGSNPSLMFDNPNYCLVCDGYYTHASAADPLRRMATPSLLTFERQGGVGDVDGLGFNTVYFYYTGDINTVEVDIPQVKIGFNLLWRYWQVNDPYVFASQETSIKSNASRDCIIRRPVMAYADQNGLLDATTAGYYLIVESPITYFTGHRGWQKTSNGDLNIYNHLDVGSHLGWKISSGASGAVINEDWVSMYNESAAFHYQLGNTVTLTMNNYFAYPTMLASGGIAYLVESDHRSSANGGFDATSATAFPANTVLGGATMDTFAKLQAALELTSVGAGDGPQAMTIDLNTFENCNFELQANSPCVGTGYMYWGTDPNPLDFNKVPFTNIWKDLWPIQSTHGPFHPSNVSYATISEPVQDAPAPNSVFWEYGMDGAPGSGYEQDAIDPEVSPGSASIETGGANVTTLIPGASWDGSDVLRCTSQNGPTEQDGGLHFKLTDVFTPTQLASELTGESYVQLIFKFGTTFFSSMPADSGWKLFWLFFNDAAHYAQDDPIFGPEISRRSILTLCRRHTVKRIPELGFGGTGYPITNELGGEYLHDFPEANYSIAWTDLVDEWLCADWHIVHGEGAAGYAELTLHSRNSGLLTPNPLILVSEDMQFNTDNVSEPTDYLAELRFMGYRQGVTATTGSDANSYVDVDRCAVNGSPIALPASFYA